MGIAFSTLRLWLLTTGSCLLLTYGVSLVQPTEAWGEEPNGVSAEALAERVNLPHGIAAGDQRLAFGHLANGRVDEIQHYFNVVDHGSFRDCR